MKQFGVYRLWSWHGRLLYVGKGFDGAEDRLREHRKRPWGRFIDRKTWQPCRSEAAALRVEAKAIVGEGPLFNVVHNRVDGAELEARLVATLEAQAR